MFKSEDWSKIINNNQIVAQQPQDLGEVFGENWFRGNFNGGYVEAIGSVTLKMSRFKPNHLTVTFQGMKCCNPSGFESWNSLNPVAGQNLILPSIFEDSSEDDD